MQSQQEIEASIAEKKKWMTQYLKTKRSGIESRGFQGRAMYLKFFRYVSEITECYHWLIANSEGGAQKKYRDEQSEFNRRVEVFIEERKRIYGLEQDDDKSSEEFEKLVELYYELDKKRPEERLEALKQYAAKWFGMTEWHAATISNLDDYRRCGERRKVLNQILEFVVEKYPNDALLIQEIKKGGERLITAQKNFVKKQIVFLESRNRVSDDPSLIMDAELMLKLVSDDKSFSAEKDKLEKAIRSAKMFNYCKKFSGNPSAILDRFRDIASKNTNPFMAAIQESVRGKDIERLQACIRQALDSSVNIDEYYERVNNTINALLEKMKRKTKFGRVGMGNFETVLKDLKAEIAEASQPDVKFSEKLSAAKSELSEKPTEQSAVVKSLIHSDVSNAGDAEDAVRAESDNSNAKKKRPRRNQSRDSE